MELNNEKLNALEIAYFDALADDPFEEKDETVLLRLQLEDLYDELEDWLTEKPHS